MIRKFNRQKAVLAQIAILVLLGAALLLSPATRSTAQTTDNPIYRAGEYGTNWTSWSELGTTPPIVGGSLQYPFTSSAPYLSLSNYVTQATSTVSTFRFRLLTTQNDWDVQFFRLVPDPADPTQLIALALPAQLVTLGAPEADGYRTGLGSIAVLDPNKTGVSTIFLRSTGPTGTVLLKEAVLDNTPIVVPTTTTTTPTTTSTSTTTTTGPSTTTSTSSTTTSSTTTSTTSSTTTTTLPTTTTSSTTTSSTTTTRPTTTTSSTTTSSTTTTTRPTTTTTSTTRPTTTTSSTTTSSTTTSSTTTTTRPTTTTSSTTTTRPTTTTSSTTTTSTTRPTTTTSSTTTTSTTTTTRPTTTTSSTTTTTTTRPTTTTTRPTTTTTSTTTTTVPTASCPLGMFRADYYNSTDLSGPIALSRCEAEINHRWSWMAPLPGVLYDFSVRWTGNVELKGGLRRFRTVSDDGVRVKLDGKVILDNWTMHAPTVDRASAYVTGGVHTIVVEYFDGIYDATAKLTIR